MKIFKLKLSDQSGNEANFITKTTALGIFDFRSFLDLAMLITESGAAWVLRSAIFDIVIDTINKRQAARPNTSISETTIISYFQEENYRKDFIDALRDYVDMGNFKYALYTDKIYVTIFNEKAQEYRKVLRLENPGEADPPIRMILTA